MDPNLIVKRTLNNTKKKILDSNVVKNLSDKDKTALTQTIGMIRPHEVSPLKDE